MHVIKKVSYLYIIQQQQSGWLNFGNMKTFIEYYKQLDLNKRINLKGVGAMLNPWLNGFDCRFLENIKDLQSLEISFARVLTFDQITWTNCGERIFFSIDWDSKIRPTFDNLKNLRNHGGRSHSMYPTNSFDYLNLGTCNH